jgi:hypothetical protein
MKRQYKFWYEIDGKPESILSDQTNHSEHIKLIRTRNPFAIDVMRNGKKVGTYERGELIKKASCESCGKGLINPQGIYGYCDKECLEDE